MKRSLPSNMNYYVSLVKYTNTKQPLFSECIEETGSGQMSCSHLHVAKWRKITTPKYMEQNNSKCTLQIVLHHIHIYI